LLEEGRSDREEKKPLEKVPEDRTPQSGKVKEPKCPRGGKSEG